MIHPGTELRLVNPHVGYGVFATEFIPKGTLVYVQDPLEISLSPEAYAFLDPHSRAVAEKYSFIDPSGRRILSWDFAKYVNHSCRPNTISTAWGFEIAIRDIQPGEEITDEYGLFNLEWEMACACEALDCRQVIRPDDADRLFRRWDRWIRQAMIAGRTVPQPLHARMDETSREIFDRHLAGALRYRSVRSLRFAPTNTMA